MTPSTDHDPDSWRFIYGHWRGRVSRRQFWLYGVLVVLGLGVLGHALLGIAGVSPQRADTLLNVSMMYLFAAVSAKRWQDRGRSAWWVLLMLVPVIGTLWTLLDNGFVRGAASINAFGPPAPASPAWLR